jgi:hypothetical protein
MVCTTRTTGGDASRDDDDAVPIERIETCEAIMQRLEVKM